MERPYIKNSRVGGDFPHLNQDAGISWQKEMDVPWNVPTKDSEKSWVKCTKKA